ncbi:SDR family oxidoreductase, partial [Myxococcota bacterium]|nr:SDR family oxidoreductase [Myxococcota bacterium]
AALFVPSRESVLDVVRMERQMERLGVTHLTTTPTWFSHFNGRSPSLTGRTFILGGEVLRLEHIDNVLENNIVFNSYGPTETTVACAYHRVSPDDPALIPLGLPLPGYEVSVRRFGKRQPAGIPGEICVGGSGITPGYVSGGSLTGLPLQKDETSGASYYGTGDLGYFDQTGMIHFSGRQDRQVKLSGYRVELGEIESALRSIPGVTAATVLLDTTKKLTARLNATDDFSMEAFVTSSRSLLPPYMIPRSIILNGEMQKEKPEGEENLPGECGEILPMYEQVLGRTITPETDFFEAGGDSLGIMELYGLLREHWELTLEDLFVYPTPRALSVRMKKTESPDFRGLIQKIFSQGPALMEKHVSNPPYVFSPFEVTTLLITGATGFLGSYLVREFLEQTDAHLILGVRGSMETIYHRIRERLDFYFSAGFFDEYAHRITMVPMDLTQPYCGLSLNEFKHLSNSCDAVIHAAALVKHVGLLSGFMEVNVTGTQTLLQITDFNPDCFFLHISTASLGGSRESESNPYLVTKRMSEEIIFDSESRARCSICRVGNVVFESGTGRFQKNIHENAFYLFLKLMVESGFMFDYQGEILDFSFVDQVARGIRLLLQTAEFQGRDCTLLNSEHLSPSGFVSLMNRGRDRIRLLSPDDFLREIDSLSPESRNRFRLILENLVHFYPTPDPRFPLADPWLSALGAPFESVEVSHIERMLDYCRTTGFIGEIQ